MNKYELQRIVEPSKGILSRLWASTAFIWLCVFGALVVAWYGFYYLVIALVAIT